MSILATDARLGAWVAPDEGAPRRALCCPFEAPYMPCASRDLLLFCCQKANDCLLLSRRTLEPVCVTPAMPALCGLVVSRCGRYVYQLSGETDAVHARHAGTGELLYAAKAGVFPRMLRLHPGDRALLVAGGAAGEAYLLRAPELTRERVIPTRGACFAADFWRGGLALVCAMEGDAIQTAVYTLKPRGVRPRKLIELPGQPGAMRVCPDGRAALLSTPDGLMKLDLETGRLLWNLPEWALCMRIAMKGGQALISDTLTGRACVLWHELPWLSRPLGAGTDTQADMV